MNECVSLHVFSPLEIERTLGTGNSLDGAPTFLQMDSHRNAISSEFAALK
jgi:hypothetical protein